MNIHKVNSMYPAGRGINVQAGFSLMETVVAMSISLVVTAAMVALMANSLGNTSRIVNMTKLSDDLRSTMQMLTRDVRRTSYNAAAYLCYGNEDCFKDGTVTMAGDTVTMAGDITINDDEDCFTFLLDRGNDGNSTNDDAGGFRLNANSGALEMWTGGSSPDCAANDSDWVQVTNPASMNITNFNVNDDDLSYSTPIYTDSLGNTISQRVRKVRFRIDAQLVNATSISRRVEDVITLRNDVLL